MAVVGIGSCAWDVLAVVDRFPKIDTKKEVLSWEEQGGGTLGNEMAALSRLGVPCRFFGIVGDDREGAAIRQSLKEEGVDTSGVVARPRSLSHRPSLLSTRPRGPGRSSGKGLPAIRSARKSCRQTFCRARTSCCWGAG